jgi:hypothetical protein
MANNNFWQLVFNQSKVNGAEYFGDRLPSNSWDWPKDTFLQKRLKELKKRRPNIYTETPEANRTPDSSTHRKRRHTHREQPNWLHKAESTSSVEGH